MHFYDGATNKVTKIQFKIGSSDLQKAAETPALVHFRTLQETP